MREREYEGGERECERGREGQWEEKEGDRERGTWGRRRKVSWKKCYLYNTFKSTCVETKVLYIEEIIQFPYIHRGKKKRKKMTQHIIEFNMNIKMFHCGERHQNVQSSSSVITRGRGLFVASAASPMFSGHLAGKMEHSPVAWNAWSGRFLPGDRGS